MITAYPIQRAVLGGLAGIHAALLSALVPTTLVFSTQPDDATEGYPFGQQPVVTVKDQFGNTLTSFTGNVTMAKASGAGTLAGTLVVAAVAGVATFTNLQINGGTGAVTLEAAITLPSLMELTATSDSFDVAASDPLAGFTWSARLQTHAGDNVPLGLWQDVAMTIPATMDFDPVAAWSDELSASGVVFSQSSEASQPILIFEGGVPTLVFDGVDDYLESTFDLASPWSLTFSGKKNFEGSGRMINSSTVNQLVTFARASNSVFLGGAVTNDTTVNPGTDAAVGTVTEDTEAHFYVDSVDRTDSTAFSGIAFPNICLGGPNEYADCYLTSFLGMASVYSAPTRAIVETYIATLNP